MNFSYRNHDIGCGTALLLGLIVLVVIFGAPWIVQIAWTAIAVQMFRAPALSYWAAFMGTWAMHIIFDLNVNVRRKD